MGKINKKTSSNFFGRQSSGWFLKDSRTSLTISFFTQIPISGNYNGSHIESLPPLPACSKTPSSELLPKNRAAVTIDQAKTKDATSPTNSSAPH